jgi:uncharacterized protein
MSVREHQNILIAGGTGFIGQALVRDRLRSGDHVTVLGRSQKKITETFQSTVTPLTWDQLNHSSDISQFDSIINLTGANIGDKLWKKKRKKEILASRIASSQTLAGLCASLGEHAPRLFNASAIGIYGVTLPDRHGLTTAIDENIKIPAAGYSDFLQEVACRWEEATTVAKDVNLSVVNLRFAVVLSRQGGVLKKLLPFYKFHLGQKIASGQQAFSWVSLQDVISSIDFLINHPDIKGPINIVSPECVSQAQFSNKLAAACHRRRFLRLPAMMVKILFGQMGDELLIQGQNVAPSRLQQQGYPFKHASLDAFLASEFSE